MAARTPEKQRQKRIFLTGVTGVVGAHLLKRILAETSHKVFCLVRAKTLAEGLERVTSLLKVYDPSGSLIREVGSRLQIVLGDLTQDQLGISPGVYQELTEQVEVTLHAAASTNLFLSLRRTEPINVGGTKRMIEFALQTSTKYLCYISTYTVMGDKVFDSRFTFSEKDLDVGQGFAFMGYQESKFLAEKQVREARNRGLLWNIMRPGQIFGEAATGNYPSEQTNVSGLFLDIFKTVMETGIAFRSEVHFDVTPVDFVSQAILHLALERDTVYETYHLLNPDRKTYTEVIQLIADLGYEIEMVTQERYKQMLLQSTLSVDGKKYKSATTQAFKWWFGREPFHFTDSAVTDCAATYAILKQAGIICPELDDKLMTAYARHGILEGYFPRPAVSERITDPEEAFEWGLQA